jgi:hypothetical protein
VSRDIEFVKFSELPGVVLNRNNFIWIALLVAFPLLALQLIGGVRVTAEDQGIPLFTLLAMNEFGAILCAIAAGVTIQVMKKSGIQKNLLAATAVAVVFTFIFVWRLLLLYPAG